MSCLRTTHSKTTHSKTTPKMYRWRSCRRAFLSKTPKERHTVADGLPYTCEIITNK